MTYYFFIQGEGRGHLVQALAVQEMLERRGHQVAGAAISSSADRLPLFFKERFRRPICLIDSPAFVLDRKEEGIKMASSIAQSLGRSPRYLRSLRKIRQAVNLGQPDALVNFYEPLAGIYQRLSRKKRPFYCLGNQYVFGHPAYVFPPAAQRSRYSLLAYNRLTAPGGAKKIALSLTPLPDLPAENLYVCPPVIRQEIKDRPLEDQGFLLAYVLNPGYSRQIMRWCAEHPEIRVEAFWDTKDAEPVKHGSNLQVHPLSAHKFADYLGRCHAYLGTAGFDAIAEAAFLKKGMLLVPIKNHIEQRCNAFQAAREGLGVCASEFNLSLLLSKDASAASSAHDRFRAWVQDNDDKIVRLLEER